MDIKRGMSLWRWIFLFTFARGVMVAIRVITDVYFWKSFFSKNITLTMCYMLVLTYYDTTLVTRASLRWNCRSITGILNGLHHRRDAWITNVFLGKQPDTTKTRCFGSSLFLVHLYPSAHHYVHICTHLCE